LSSPEWLHRPIKTERIERSDAAMAQTTPFPQTPVSIIEVHARQSHCSDFHACRLPFLAGKQPDIYYAKAQLRRQRGFYVNIRVPIETTESSYTPWKDFKHRVVTMPWI